MRNLSKVIDKIIKIEPTLKVPLLAIKTKWEKNAHKSLYWKQLLKLLNTKITPEHPKRVPINNILNPKKKPIKKVGTFEAPTPGETIIGILPENIECKIRKYDRLNIEYSKRLVGARMTNDVPLMIELAKKFDLLEINQKKIWFDIKNHFNLWEVKSALSFLIRTRENLLVLTSTSFGSEAPSSQIDGNTNSIIELDPDILMKFFRFLNNPPPGFNPPDNGPKDR